MEETDDRIDMEKLKVREKIHFYADVPLFEDELGDNGTSVLSVKIVSWILALTLFLQRPLQQI